MMRLFVLATAVSAACTAAPTPAAAMDGTPKHSSVEVTAKPDGKNLQLTFKLKPNQGLVTTLDAPWKFEVKSADLAFAKTTMNKAEMDDKLPGFVVTTSEAPKKANGDVEYSLTSFVCTENKTTCYREVHKGTYNYKTAAN